MERILLFIKHHFKFLWKIIEWVNGIIFSLLFKSNLEQVLPGVFNDFLVPPFEHRKLSILDAGILHHLIHSQNPNDLEYFSPHDLKLSSIKSQFKNRSFLMMGVFEGEKLVGYFFLRFFANRKCFVGRLIDKNYRGKGIGSQMNNIMYETAWRINFRCFSTISRNNLAVMKAHSKNPSIVIRKELKNNYMLVEFLKQKGNVCE